LVFLLATNLCETVLPLRVVLYGCETRSFTFREDRRLRVFENRVLGEYLDLRGTRLQGSGENYIMRNLMIYIPHSIFGGNEIEKNGIGGACSTYGGEERLYRVLVGKPEVKDHLVDPGIDGRII